MFVAWMYFSNHIVPSAGTRIVAINFALARGNRSRLVHLFCRQRVWLLLLWLVLL